MERQAEELRRGPNLGGSASTSAGQGAAEPLSASAQAQSGQGAAEPFSASAQAEGRPMAEATGAQVEESPPDAVAEAVALLARLHPVLIRQKREGTVWDVEAESAATVHLLNELVFWDL